MFERIKNYFLCLKYPFLKVRNQFSDRPLGYSFTWYDSIPDGWQIAFGKKLCKDLKEALIKDHCLKTFRFRQIKEKWGELCVYADGFGDESDRVLAYYQAISVGYCIHCGEPARYASTGWIQFYCEDCMSHNLVDTKNVTTLDELDERLAYLRLTKKDIPVRVCSDKKMQAIYDSIDYKKLWDIRED